MDKNKLQEYKKLFHDTLFDDVLPFWLEHAIDRVNGGIYTYMTPDGAIVSDHKSVWVQGRFMWVLSYLCNHYGENREWLSIAKSCGDFLDKHCFADDGRMYFIVSADGRPVRKRRYTGSEFFYVIGNAEYAKATGSAIHMERAKRVFELWRSVTEDPSSDPRWIYPKYEPDIWKMEAHGTPMGLINACTVMRDCDPDNTALYDELSRKNIEWLLRDFYRPELKCVLENVRADGTPWLDIPAGRLVNPGHSIESSWFVLREGRTLKDDEICKKALDILDWSLDLGWDREFGGIRYFVDIKGYGPEQYEHDMKLWWPHNEAIIATLMAYDYTGDKKWADWFEKLVDYSFSHFKCEDGEWAGYLLRDGSKQQPVVKGSYYKGPFHLPRMLMTCDLFIDGMLNK